MKTDAELLQAWASNDQRAGYTLYQRHAEAVVRFLRNKVAERDLDDLLQSTFMKCFEHSDRYQPEASFRAFVLGFARNLLLHHYRSWVRKGEKVDFGVTSMAELGVSPSGLVAQRQDEQQFLDALRGLPIEHQILLELFYWENMAGNELAELYGVPEGTIRTRLRRARELLAKALPEGFVPLGESAAGIEVWVEKIRRQLTDIHPPATGR